MAGEAPVSNGFTLPGLPPAAEPLSSAEALAMRRKHWEYYKDMAQMALKEADAQLSLLANSKDLSSRYARQTISTRSGENRIRLPSPQPTQAAAKPNSPT